MFLEMNRQPRYFSAQDEVNINASTKCTWLVGDRSISHAHLFSLFKDFVVNFVHQVEFMAKHPILAMFHADGYSSLHWAGACRMHRCSSSLVCSSAYAIVNVLPRLSFKSVQRARRRLDFVSMRFVWKTHRRPRWPQAIKRSNWISVLFALIFTTVSCVTSRMLSLSNSIYSDRTKKLQNRTFDSGCLPSDISKFIASAHTSNVEHILLLSNFDDKTNSKPTLPFSTFNAYYRT